MLHLRRKLAYRPSCEASGTSLPLEGDEAMRVVAMHDAITFYEQAQPDDEQLLEPMLPRRRLSISTPIWGKRTN